MTVVLGIFAGIILFGYSLYFGQIIKGGQQEFEQEMLTVLAGWIADTGAEAKKIVWILVILSVAMEIAYFTLTVLIVDNLLLLAFTGAFILLETLHLFSLITNFIRFFAGRIVLKQLFIWRVERISAMLFFTHSFLLLADIIFF